MVDYMHEKLKPVIGTIPGWMTVILLAMVSYGTRNLVEELKSTRDLTVANDKRTAVLETQSKAVESAIIELRLGQKDVVAELRSIGSQLQQRGNNNR